MPISLIKIDNFRNLNNVELSPISYGLNIISGINGSGKTSLLEAIYYLGHNRSFRTSTATKMIKHQNEKFSIYSQLVSDNEIMIPIGMERYVNGDAKLKMSEKDVSSISKLTKLLPTLVINSQSHSIFESGPIYRRKYLDWGLFFQNEAFLPVWRQYERTLKQRNMALKARCSKDELNIWSEELVKQGQKLHEMRLEYIKLIEPYVKKYTNELLKVEKLTIDYFPGWEKSSSFNSELAKSYSDEIRLGSTQVGPQRADFEVLLDDVSAQNFLSRGQQKLLICAMILAQGSLLSEHKNKAIIYLVDDLPSELDTESRYKLVSLLAKQRTQIFITAIECKSICDAVNDSSDTPISVFHVEHGTVSTRTTL